MALLLAGMLALGIIIVFWVLAQAVSAPSRVDQAVGQYARPRTLEELELAKPFSKRVLLPIVRGLAEVLARWTPKSILESTRHKLNLAGDPLDLPPLEFLGLRGLATIVTMLVFSILFSLLGENAILVFGLTIVGAILGFYFPLLWLDLRIRDRKEQIQSALPDALDMLTICVEAGWALDTAMTRVSERWDNELGRTFARVVREVRVGKSRQEALRDMANRADVDDLTNLIAAIIQSERLGTGIAKVLRIQSEQMRVKRRQRAYASANQTPVKLVFPLVFLFFPALFIVVLGPALIRLFLHGL